VIGILDTNADPDEIQYPIPGNDDAIRSVSLLTRIIADAAAEGLIQRHQPADEAAAPAEPLAEWERELLEQGTAAPAADAAPAEAEPVAAETVAAPAEAEPVAETAAAESDATVTPAE